MDQKKEASSRIWFRIISRKRKQLGVPFRGTKIETFGIFLSSKENGLSVLCKLFWLFYKTFFFSPNSVPLQAVELTLPWTSECLGMCTFFRGITENRSESISQNFFRTQFHSKPLASRDLSSVADPGFLSRNPDPNFFYPGSRIFYIQDPGSASKNLRF